MYWYLFINRWLLSIVASGLFSIFKAKSIYFSDKFGSDFFKRFAKLKNGLKLLLSSFAEISKNFLANFFLFNLSKTTPILFDKSLLLLNL